MSKLNTQTNTNKSLQQNSRQQIFAAVERLEQATHEGSTPTEFLTLIDEQQSIFYRALATAYPVGYAKLLALKIANLFVARYHFIERHTKLASSPIQLMIDPSNVCQLQCPGCVHTGNPEISKLFDWPNGFLSNESFEEFIRLYGPFAFGVVFYNYGEPFLNKNTPQLIRRAKDFLLHTCLSSNLSIPKIDAEAVVRSGLNCLFASFDGATQETYGLYRRRGRIDLGYGNIQRLVEAKKHLGLQLPYIEWKFLTFEHNVHEIDLAIAKGKELGVNEVHIATPFAVDWDDPSVHVVNSPKQGQNKFTPEQNTKGPLDEWTAFETIDDAIEEAFAESWVVRGEKRGALKQESNRSSSTCRWLYQSITLDALDRIAPCCMPPQEGTNRIYGKFRVDEPEPFNAKDMSASRLAFADRGRFEQTLEEELKGRVPYCAKCDANPDLTYTLNNVRADLIHYDRLGIFEPQVFDRLTKWSTEGRFEHKETRKADGSQYLLGLLRNNVRKAFKYARGKLFSFFN
ncbi:MAG: hypothetical protein HC770_04475 [Pseudanabaena sp. CRU_2_10]|nr:hypothetical protein [Pseudanabaena sp. CRU_2_10]